MMSESCELTDFIGEEASPSLDVTLSAPALRGCARPLVFLGVEMAAILLAFTPYLNSLKMMRGY